MVWEYFSSFFFNGLKQMAGSDQIRSDRCQRAFRCTQAYTDVPVYTFKHIPVRPLDKDLSSPEWARSSVKTMFMEWRNARFMVRRERFTRLSCRKLKTATEIY